MSYLPAEFRELPPDEAGRRKKAPENRGSKTIGFISSVCAGIHHLWQITSLQNFIQFFSPGLCLYAVRCRGFAKRLFALQF